jgi:hypothetical protein
MKYEVKLWKEVDLQRGAHIATVIVDVGRIYDDWETSGSDPGYFVIGKEGKGTAQLRSYGAMYFREHALAIDILLLNNWTKSTGKLSVGLKGSGEIYKATPSSWNNTNFRSEVTKRW